MRSLWLKLMGAFALVILIGGVVDALLVNHATSGQFSQYVTQSGQAWAQRLAPTLATYYARNGSWQGVGALLGTATSPAGVPNQNSGWMMGDMMGQEQNWGMGASHETDSMMMGNDMWAWMGSRLLLADVQGRVIADSAASATSEQLSPADLNAGTAVLVNGTRVGTLLAVQSTANPTPASNFLAGVQQSTWIGSLAAALIALVLGFILFRQIVAPVGAVTSAAQRIAAGQLDQRVPVHSQDEIGQLATSFNQMADALANDRQLRRTMIADIAHELRTPLTVIQANLEAMLDGVLPTSSEEIASLRDEAALLKRLIDDLRLLSLAEAGQLKLEREPVDVGALATSAIEHVRPQAEAGGVELETEIAAHLPVVNADADRLRQVIGNLLSNALRHTPGGGRVTLRATLQSSRQPVIKVEVIDTGTGIALEDLPHVFDRFYRADKSRSRSSGGSGIGLTIVKQLVEAHSGQVGVESQPGKGTTFSFTLPAVATP
jgi:two-component system OmpR family sensor kinase/two-component system sensor histidine kinase BaeS